MKKRKEGIDKGMDDEAQTAKKKDILQVLYSESGFRKLIMSVSTTWLMSVRFFIEF